MKIILEQISQGVDQVIIRFREKTPEVQRIISCIEQQEEIITGTKDGKQFLFTPGQIIYLESIDGITFLYTEDAVYRTADSLTMMELRYGNRGFFRCSKSMVINIFRIDNLKSKAGNRIDAQMDNGEHVIISRRYAKALRGILKGGEE